MSLSVPIVIIKYLETGILKIVEVYLLIVCEDKNSKRCQQMWCLLVESCSSH